MIQAGIIAGIGNKSENKNIIYPEFDANINNYLVGRNTILEGLELQGNTLTAGTCILAGYRGTLEQNINLDTTAYIYGEFTISFGTDIDSFNIVTSDTPLPYETNVSSINSAGTYYLLLYISGEKNSELIADKKYPTKANYSDETTTLLSAGTIQEGATGTTLPVNSHTNRPKEIATTQYVYNQIEEQIGYGYYNGNVYNASGELLFSYKLYRKSKYVIGEIINNSSSSNIGIGSYDKIPDGFLPIKTIYFGCILYAIDGTNCILSISTNGLIKVESFATNENSPSLPTSSTFGYQCQ